MSLPAGQTATAVSVLWPGGKKTHSPLPTDAHEIEITADGNLKRLN